jgi:hypothetical protein
VYRREESAKVWKQKQSDAGRGIGAPEGEGLSRASSTGGKMEQRGGGGVDGRASVPNVRAR